MTTHRPSAYVRLLIHLLKKELRNMATPSHADVLALVAQAENAVAAANARVASLVAPTPDDLTDISTGLTQLITDIGGIAAAPVAAPVTPSPTPDPTASVVASPATPSAS